MHTCCFGNDVLCAMHNRKVGALAVSHAMQGRQLILLLRLLPWLACADPHVGHDLCHTLQHRFVHMPTDCWNWLQHTYHMLKSRNLHHDLIDMYALRSKARELWCGLACASCMRLLCSSTAMSICSKDMPRRVREHRMKTRQCILSGTGHMLKAGLSYSETHALTVK